MIILILTLTVLSAKGKTHQIEFCDVTILFPKSSMYMYSEQQVVPVDYLPSVQPLLAFPNG